MKISYEGSEYEFDVTRLSVEECEAVEKFCAARGLGDWSNQLVAANTRALQALWWVVRRHAGEDPGPIARRDPSFLPLAFNRAYGAAEAAEAAAAEAAEAAAADEPDPTRPPAVSSPAPASTPTPPLAAAPGPSLPG